MDEDAAFIEEQVDRHHAWFSKCLPMIASENIISPMAREMLLTDFGDRYAEGLPHERYYQGNLYVDEVEDRVVALAKKIFRVRHVDPRLISGTVANMAVYFALLEPGDIMTSVALSHGAHISSAKFGAAGMRGVHNVNYPFDLDRMNIDVDETAKLIKQVRPRVAAFGQSVFLFPTPLTELRDAFQEAGCDVWYDGAHVLGLIAGGKFQDPLHEGADVLTGSTHKTLPGPQHGLLLSDSEDEKFVKRLQRAVFPGVVSNHHLHAMAALGIALAECADRARRGGPGRRREGRRGPGEGEHHHEQEPPALGHVPCEAERRPAGDAGAHPPRDAGGADAGGRGPVRPRRGQGRDRRESRGRCRFDPEGVQHGPLLLHERRGSPPPMADRLITRVPRGAA